MPARISKDARNKILKPYRHSELQVQLLFENSRITKFDNLSGHLNWIIKKTSGNEQIMIPFIFI